MNPQFWHGHTIGDGDAEQLQGQHSGIEIKPGLRAALEIAQYTKMGAGKLALSKLVDGQEFNANNYRPGTIIRTTQESLILDNAGGPSYRPMTAFSGLELPHRANLASDELTIAGYEHSYIIKQWVNVIIRAKRGNNTAVIVKAEAVDDEPSMEKIISALGVSRQEYTVGATYHLADSNKEHLTRISSLIVCANGGERRRRSRFWAWMPGLRPASRPTT